MRLGVAGIEPQRATELPFGVMKPIEVGIGIGEIELPAGGLEVDRRRQFEPGQGGIGRFDRLDQHGLQAVGRQGACIQRQGAFDRHQGLGGAALVTQLPGPGQPGAGVRGRLWDIEELGQKVGRRGHGNLAE